MSTLQQPAVSEVVSKTSRSYRALFGRGLVIVVAAPCGDVMTCVSRDVDSSGRAALVHFGRGGLVQTVHVGRGNSVGQAMSAAERYIRRTKTGYVLRVSGRRGDDRRYCPQDPQHRRGGPQPELPSSPDREVQPSVRAPAPSVGDLWIVTSLARLTDALQQIRTGTDLLLERIAIDSEAFIGPNHELRGLNLRDGDRVCIRQVQSVRAGWTRSFERPRSGVPRARSTDDA